MKTGRGVGDDGEVVVVHRAGPVVARAQRCDRCGVEFPLAAGEVGWQAGALIRHTRTRSGETMKEIREEQRADVPYCATVA